MTLPDTQIAVALDDDDDANYESFSWDSVADRVIWSKAPREDSLGAKYNRAQGLVKADLYVLWADDMVMPDKGWDAQLQRAAEVLPDQCGIVLFGEIPGVMQPGLAMTAEFIEAQGFFNVPYFYYWWGETWPMEIATMAGAFIHADVRVSLLGEIRGKSRGVREIEFWARLFDGLRPSRRVVAEKIIRASSRPDNEKAQLLTSLDEWERKWAFRNSKLRNPVEAKRLEEYYAFDSEPTPRYLRLKSQAEKMMEELSGRS